MSREPEARDVTGMDPCDVVAGMDYGDEFTLRGQRYTVREGCWTMGGDSKGEYVQVPVWSPATGRASTVMVRERNKLTNVKRRHW